MMQYISYLMGVNFHSAINLELNHTENIENTVDILLEIKGVSIAKRI